MTISSRMRLIATVLVVFAFGSVQAMDCRPIPPNKIAERAKMAFVGTVMAVGESSYKPYPSCWEQSVHRPQCGGKLVTLEVTESIRGTIPSTVTIVSEDACYCLGPYWTKGAKYVVVEGLSSSNDKALMVAANQCGGTRELTDHTLPSMKALREAKQTN